MQFTKRLIRCALFTACCCIPGLATFYFVRLQPRCTIVAPDDLYGLSIDGEKLLTFERGPAEDGHWHVWDTRSAERVFEWYGGWKLHHVSFDEQTHCLLCPPDKVLLIDWPKGESREVKFD